MEVTDQQKFEQEQPQPQPLDQSLNARMEQRADTLQRETTEKFDIPGYEGLLAVELRRLGYRKVKQIQNTNARVRDEATRDIYNIADQIAWATVGLFEVVGETDDGPVYKELSDTWVDLAHRLPESDDIDAPRKAILFLTGGDQRIHFLANAYGQWQAAGRPQEDEEVRRDFEVTG